MALNSLIYADVPLRNCSLTHSLTHVDQDNPIGCLSARKTKTK